MSVHAAASSTFASPSEGGRPLHGSVVIVCYLVYCFMYLLLLVMLLFTFHGFGLVQLLFFVLFLLHGSWSRRPDGPAVRAAKRSSVQSVAGPPRLRLFCSWFVYVSLAAHYHHKYNYTYHYRNI